jgi:type I restriction enzyme S subunit
MIPQGLKCCLGQRMVLLRINRDVAEPQYVLYALQGEAVQRSISVAGGTGSTVSNLRIPVLKGLQILAPEKSEQQAIAAALCDVDALLDGLDRLIAKKQDLKQAAMQQLLTGQTRLPGFNGEWKEQAIVELAEVGRGRVISHSEISKSTEPRYPVFSSQTSNHGIMGYLDTYDFDGDYVTWTTDGANAGTVFARSGKFNCTNVCGTIKPRFGDYRFIAAALGRVSKLHVSRHLGNPKLMNDVMKRIKIRIPPSNTEQSTIAAVLSDIDADLSALVARRDKTRALKQAMMQELLTGKTRLIPIGDTACLNNPAPNAARKTA